MSEFSPGVVRVLAFYRFMPYGNPLSRREAPAPAGAGLSSRSPLAPSLSPPLEPQLLDQPRLPARRPYRAGAEFLGCNASLQEETFSLTGSTKGPGSREECVPNSVYQRDIPRLPVEPLPSKSLDM
ncbi:hypothetical protein GUJ93_ZPchr0014g46906 [Zizania palustris]|uniref:Uncharacterized protein n=1 Tax=Zizania palustris TaxID=103762 RepID=A0A8J5SWJ8_ZIZPA|nr:hypothetical protein GUJ93_ZPchr0014g46906 [Zizania palustris]